MTDQTNQAVPAITTTTDPVGTMYMVEMMYPSEAYYDTTFEQDVINATTRWSDNRGDSGMGFGFRDITWDDLTDPQAVDLRNVLAQLLRNQFGENDGQWELGICPQVQDEELYTEDMEHPSTITDTTKEN